jgi:alpha-glucosidase
MADGSPWWARAAVYQVYLRSFQDSDGDGIGDLEGARRRLPELVRLGMDTVWLSPVHPSPDRDFGYDVADYDDVAAVYGGRDALRAFVDDAHAQGLRVLLDGVFNHTSDEHAWFRSSAADPTGPHADWYHWHTGPTPPNNWASTFGGPAWTFHEPSQRWYLHSFAPEQPDLNWANPAVEQAVLDVLQRWFDFGVDGFRLDVFNNYAKHPTLADNPWRTDLLGRVARYVYPFIAQEHDNDRDRPELAAILAKMRSICDTADRPLVLVGETLDERFQYDRAASWCGPDRLHLAFHFRWLHTKWSASAFHAAIQAQLDSFSDGLTPTWVLGNHDFPRLATRWGSGRHTDARMKLVALMQLLLPGMVVVYQGDELGISEARIPRRQIQDPPGKRFWPFYQGRDGCRTPMAWSADPGAGFSSKPPWLPLHSDWRTRNVAVQSTDPRSIWSAYRVLLQLRRTLPVLQTGAVALPAEAEDDVFTYLRHTSDEAVRVVANLSTSVVRWPLPSGEKVAGLLWQTGDVAVRGELLELGPLAGGVVELGAYLA